MIVVMEPALDVLNRALHGDAGARSFLDRTASIYVLDATEVSKPKTYGCWNFIHQAINEIERAEASPRSPPAKLFPHVQLLANMALRVSRRSNALDKQLVATCIENAAKYHGSANEAQALIDINVEIRDIVMGRIAALALDPSFHRHTTRSSAFSDAVVMETFCGVLAANAVSNGPAAVNHLVSEWIVPASNNLPPFCLACVTLHLSIEASRKSAPLGTQDMLQRLSNTVMAGVLVPVLAEAIKESNPNSSPNPNNDASTDSNGNNGNGVSMHEFNSRIAALGLRAMNQWCEVTDLSLAQIKHICSKVQINIVDIISDAMYSDSRMVVDALGELIEAVVDRHQVPTVSEQRMTQTRYIMQVDEASFRSNITTEQLVLIESKEMSSILEELVSAVGLQRFRFVDRQNNGDHDVCRSLARIAASVCIACTKLSAEGRQLKSGPGLLDLLLKSASHPSVNICAIALEVFAQLVGTEIGLVNQLLPVLQRRAITPHHFVNGIPTLEASDLCGVNFHEFEIFRDTVLADCLVCCWKANPENYMASCTAAIEEFCFANSSPQVSFHLEAALFCVGAVADDAISERSSPHSACLERCTTALAGKPQSLTSNPLTLTQVCIFLQKYDKWYNSSQIDGVLDVGTDLSLSTFTLCASNFPNEPVSVEMRREADVSPYAEAAKALQALLCPSSQHFLSNQAISALGAGWEASYAAANRSDIITVDDRKAICIGICHVLASLPDNQRAKSLLALAMPALDCLETMTQHANQASSNHTSREELDVVLDRISSEIVMVTTMARAFTDAFSIKNSSMESGCRTSDGHAAIVEPALAIVKRAWPSVVRVASAYNYHDSVSDSLGYFMTQCLPPECIDDLSVSFVKELCLVATSIIQSDCNGKKPLNFQPVLDFLKAFVKIHGDVIDKNAKSSLEGGSTPSNAERGREVGKCLETLLLTTVVEINNLLGSTWTSPQRQGNGQPAFESKVEPVDDKRQVSNDALSAMFSLLKTCAERCPVFLLHLPAAPGLDRDEDLLLRRAVESAVTSLLEPEVATSKGAMEFLLATVVLTQSSSDNVRHITEEILSRVRQSIVAALVLGACGKFNAVTLDDAASLLRRILLASPSAEETRSSLLQALSTEHFVLGAQAKNISLECFLKCSRNAITNEKLSEFLHSVWELHQVESPEPLEQSDSVAKFCKKYSS